MTIRKCRRSWLHCFNGLLILLAGSLAACHQVNSPNQGRPKVAFEIADVDPRLDEVKKLVGQFATDYGYRVVDSSEGYPSSGQQIFFVVHATDRASVDLLNSHDKKSLFVSVFAEDSSDHWKTVACHAHAQLAARWPTIKQTRGDVTIAELSATCIDRGRTGITSGRGD